MKHTDIFFGLLCSVLAVSCNNGSNQRAAIRKEFEDSVKNAHQRTVDSLDKVQVQENRDDSLISLAVGATMDKLKANAAFKDKLQRTTAMFYSLKYQIKSATANLVVAYDRLNQIQKFHFARTKSERESQIRSQSMVIQYGQERIGILSENLKIAKAKLLKMNPAFNYK